MYNFRNWHRNKRQGDKCLWRNIQTIGNPDLEQAPGKWKWLERKMQSLSNPDLEQALGKKGSG